MLDQIMDSEDSELCKSILAIVSAVYRPPTLDELVAFVDMPSGIASEYKALSEIIGLCGSFLTLRERTVSFVHQSAKEFLIERAPKDIYLPRSEDVHCTIFSQLLLVMSRTLKRDVYSLASPRISIDQVKPPVLDPLATVQYSCFYWVDHMLECNTRGSVHRNLKDNRSVHKFLCQRFLYWLKALSLLRSLSHSIVIIRKLENWVQVSFCGTLSNVLGYN